MGFLPQWAIGTAFVVAVLWLASAATRLLRGKGGSTTGLTIFNPASSNAEEVAELRRTIEALQNRLGEVEERLDFTERLLASRHEAEQLGRPQA